MNYFQISVAKITYFCFLLLQMMLFGTFFTPLSARNNCPDQGPRLSAEEYCRLYASEAQRQMKEYGIPASITLAQGMFESGYGSSYIAVIGKNHFGIKAYRDWKGPTIECDDDRSAEPFCKFESVLDSYEHHSKFLRNNTRYAKLFKLSTRDYKGWAKGLKECGYATSPTYPERLIEIIERYGLDKFDQGKDVAVKTSANNDKSTSAIARHKLYSTAARGGLKYVHANKGDYLIVIASEFGISERRLRRYNEMPKYYPLKEGEIVYLQSKKSKADKNHALHVVKEGESLHSIAQRYGITTSSIIKRNNLRSGAVQVGQTLKLR